DFGEGTMFEPTVEFGYSFLNTVQGFTGVHFGEEELELIYDLYIARKEHADNDTAQETLDLVFNHLVTLNVSQARALLHSLD
ncbi:MAG: hypothetical protein MI700_03910, partial [Balneolales bacterium]|nr:hypothetical protein [Balneolales bacterium]